MMSMYINVLAQTPCKPPLNVDTSCKSSRAFSGFLQEPSCGILTPVLAPSGQVSPLQSPLIHSYSPNTHMAAAIKRRVHGVPLYQAPHCRRRSSRACIWWQGALALT